MSSSSQLPPSPTSKLYTLSFLLALLSTLLVAAILRLRVILPSGKFQERPLRRRKRPHATRILVVLGSGGHTHEMFYLLRDLDTRKYTHRTYIVGSGDAFSAQRAAEFEEELERRAKEKERKKEREEQAQATEFHTGPSNFDIATIPRARRIHQSLLTTPFTSLCTFLYAFAPLLSPQIPPEAPATGLPGLPDLIITNGPATSLLIILASLLLRFFNIKGAQSCGKCKTLYVESFARVKTLSLSGKLLVGVVDRFLVQWEELEGKVNGNGGGWSWGKGRAEFWGTLV